MSDARNLVKGCSHTPTAGVGGFLTQYEKLRQVGPFCCNLIGIVRTPSDVFTSASGMPMLSFDLVSTQNERVQCMAFGANADPDIFEEGIEVAVQLAQSRKGRRGENSRLWIYDDAVVAMLALRPRKPAGTCKEIQLEFTP